MSEPDFYYEYHRDEKGKLHKKKIKLTHKCRLALDYKMPGDTDEQIMLRVKAQANAILSETDWTQAPDNNLTQEKRDEWKAYRAAVRHIRTNAESLFQNVTWPEPPAK